MDIHIPLFVLLAPLAIIAWLGFGWFWRTVVFIYRPGMPLGLSPSERFWMLIWGPFGIWLIMWLVASHSIMQRRARKEKDLS